MSTDRNASPPTNAAAPEPARRRPDRHERWTPEQVAASLRSELKVTVDAGTAVSFTGTAQQLIDEGLLPADFKFPDAWQRVPLRIVPNVRRLSNLEGIGLRRERLPRTGHSRELVDNWCIHGYVADRGNRNFLLEEAARLVEKDKYLSSPKWKDDHDRRWKAQHDAVFQKAMNFKGLVRAVKDVGAASREAGQ